MAIVFDRPAVIDPYGIGALGTALGKGFGQEIQRQMDATALQKIIGPILDNPNPQTADILKTILQISSAPISDDLKRTAMYGLHSATLKPQQESKIIEWWDAEGRKHRDAVKPGEFNDRVIEIEKQGGSFEKPSRMPVFNMKTGKKAGTIVVQENQIDQKEADLNRKNLTLNAPEKDESKEKTLNQYDDFIRTTEKELKEKNPKLTDDQAHRLAVRQWEKREVAISREKNLQKPTTIGELNSSEARELDAISKRALIDMTPEERQNFSSMSSEQLMAAIISGGGKTLSPAKKEQYIKQYSDVSDYYQKERDKILGRKGAAPRESEKKTGRDINEAVRYLKGAKTRDEAISMVKALSEKGWTREELARIAKVAGWE